MESKGGKVHVLGFNVYEEGGVLHRMEGYLPKGEELPEGMIWHIVLGKAVPREWADKEMWVDKSETVLGEDESE